MYFLLLNDLPKEISVSSGTLYSDLFSGSPRLKEKNIRKQPVALLALLVCLYLGYTWEDLPRGSHIFRLINLRPNGLRRTATRFSCYIELADVAKRQISQFRDSYFIIILICLEQKKIQKVLPPC